jgi:hypothetical protein
MSKGAVVTAVVVGGVVILGAAVLAFASSRPVVPGKQYIPPPPPPAPLTPGQLIVQTGAAVLDKLGHSDVVTGVTGGENAKGYIVKNVATGGLYSVYAGAKSVGSKIASWF